MRPWPLLLMTLALSSCAVVVAGLEPRPNLPAMPDAPPLAIDLGPNIKQEQTIEVGTAAIELRTFRGDLKRGFLAGFPGATQEAAPLTLRLSEVNVTYENLRIAGLARFRFRGSVTRGDTTLVTFAGKADGDACTDAVSSCLRSGIEAMFEKIFNDVFKGLAGPGAPVRDAPPKAIEL
ncbi:MAG: hypothetical protein INH41_05270 [Myxococcaceae bacterium]|nr:hypothetical protein [Myxococcaceae bacterium]MCA3011795.1 hypothetical protein [Myxococcaceae bacterium]